MLLPRLGSLVVRAGVNGLFSYIVIVAHGVVLDNGCCQL